MKITKRQLQRVIKESIDETEAKSLIDAAISDATLVAKDLATANRDRGSARTALVLRAMAANEKVLEQLQRLKEVAGK